MTEPLFPYQEVGGDWLAAHERGGLHDEPGVGKTGGVIRAIQAIDAERGMIVVPAGLREQWMRELVRFLPLKRRLCKGMNVHDFYAWHRGRYNIIVTSYDQATAWAPTIYRSGEILDFVAFDEAQAMKNPETQRTRALLGPHSDGQGGLINFACYAWHVTGTPMVNDPFDIYTFLRMCQCMPLSKEMFVKRYFTKLPTRWGVRTMPKPERVEELQALIANNSIRRSKADVGIFLPPVFMTSMYLDGNTDEVRKLLSEHPGLEEAIVQAIEQGGLSFLDSQHTMTLRRLVGEAKAVPYAHVLVDEMRAGELDKRVVFGAHVEALRTIQRILTKNGIRCVLITGETNERDRITYRDEFTNDPLCTVMAASIRAAGEGNNFQVACEIDMFESEWSPGRNAQAIFRVHRRGQERKVRARWITLANSIDEAVNALVARKVAAIAQIDGQEMNGAPLDNLVEMR